MQGFACLGVSVMFLQRVLDDKQETFSTDDGQKDDTYDILCVKTLCRLGHC